MVDSNLQRPNILPSEKAFAYRMKMEAMNHQGTSGGISAKDIGKNANDSARQVYRYIRLTYLMNDLLNAVDRDVIGLQVGVELSYLTVPEQEMVEEVHESTGKYPSLEQAKKIRQHREEKTLTKEIVRALSETEERDLIYTISVQPHGAYPEESETADIKVLSGIEDPALRGQLEYYVTQIHEVDEFLRTLTDVLTTWEEPTVLVLYGDHMPSLEISKDMLDLSAGGLFETEYVIWSNCGVGGADRNVKAYQLSSRVRHQRRHTDEIPPVKPVARCIRNGVAHAAIRHAVRRPCGVPRRAAV